MGANVRNILSYLLPHLVVAGAYSTRVQQTVGVHEAKDGETIFHHALSDADLSIQAFLEVVLLSRFSDLSFFSEEQDHSLNKKYFPDGMQLEVLLDPIDGTRSYVDRRENYQIIVTVHDEREIVGVICYMPRQDRCYVAQKGEGARLLCAHEMLTGQQGVPLDVSQAQGPVIVFNAPDLVERIAPYVQVKDIVASYGTEPGRHNTTDIFKGRASGMISRPCQAIDGGALAFVAKEAGAIVSTFDGGEVPSFRSHPKRVVEGVIVAATPAVHESLVKALR